MLVRLLLQRCPRAAGTPFVALRATPAAQRVHDISGECCNCRASEFLASFQINNLLSAQVIFAGKTPGERVKIVCTERHMDACENPPRVRGISDSFDASRQSPRNRTRPGIQPLSAAALRRNSTPDRFRRPLTRKRRSGKSESFRQSRLVLRAAACRCPATNFVLIA
jgi:hypothetical protein